MDDTHDESGPCLPSDSDLRWMSQKTGQKHKIMKYVSAPYDTATVAAAHVYINVIYAAAARVEIQI